MYARNENPHNSDDALVWTTICNLPASLPPFAHWDILRSKHEERLENTLPKCPSQPSVPALSRVDFIHMPPKKTVKIRVVFDLKEKKNMSKTRMSQLFTSQREHVPGKPIRKSIRRITLSDLFQIIPAGRGSS